MGGRSSTVAAVCALVVLGSAGSAQAGTRSSVVMFGEAGDYVAPGLRTYEGSKQVSLTGTTAGVEVQVGESGQQAFIFEFAPRRDDLLAPGSYSHAQRSAFRERGHPGIDIFGDGRGCNEVSGRFVVKDLGFGKGGQVKRLWLLFEQHCEGGTAALFGEVKVAIPSRSGRARALPSAIRWPDHRVAAGGTTVPITFVASRSTTPGRARLIGGGRGAFRITADQCHGRRLAAGRRCVVFVRFAPRRRGTARATLALGGGGAAARVALTGRGG